MDKKIGFDSPEVNSQINSESYIQRVEVVENEQTVPYVVIKHPPTSIEDQPHRRAVNQFKFFERFREINPESMLMYTVMSEEKFNSLLDRSNQLGPAVSLSIPQNPISFDEIDDYSRDRIHQLMGGGFDTTFFLDTKSLSYFFPSKDFRSPNLEEMVRAVEVLSVAHQWSVFPIYDFHGWRKISYNSGNDSYNSTSMLEGDRDEGEVLGERISLLKSNRSYYNKGRSDN